MPRKKVSDKKQLLRLEILEKITTLVAGGLGLVAALAWNSAISDLVNALLPSKASNLVLKFSYAIIITTVVVVVTVQLSRMVNKIKEYVDDQDTRG